MQRPACLQCYPHTIVPAHPPYFFADHLCNYWQRGMRGTSTEMLDIRCTNHHIFSLRCRDEKVIPVSWRIKPPVKAKRGFEIAGRVSKAFFNERIRETHARRNEATARLAAMQQRLESQLTSAVFECVSSLCKEAAEKTFVRTKRTSAVTGEAHQ